VVPRSARRFPRQALFDVRNRGCAHDAGEASESCSPRAGVAAETTLEHDRAVSSLLGTAFEFGLNATGGFDQLSPTKRMDERQDLRQTSGDVIIRPSAACRNCCLSSQGTFNEPSRRNAFPRIGFSTNNRNCRCDLYNSRAVLSSFSGYSCR
jgi:hypothetical protein